MLLNNILEWPRITRLGDNYTLSLYLLNTCTVWTRCKNRHTYISHLRRRINIVIYLIIFIYLFRLTYFMLCNIISLRLQMKMHFDWKPLILWSLHLYDIYKLFLGKGCPSGQWICSRFFNTFL